jgi:hypothetical protein
MVVDLTCSCGKTRTVTISVTREEFVAVCVCAKVMN